MRQSTSLLLPYFNRSIAYTIREDNFWAYSSGFVRRGLLGEALYRAETAVGGNPSWMLSLLFVIVYAIATTQVLKLASQKLTPIVFAVLCATPLVWNFSTDREVLLLLPLLLMASPPESRYRFRLGLCMLPLMVLVHEAAMLFYLPLLALTAVCTPCAKRKVEVLGAGALVLFTAMLLLTSKTNLTYRLEREVWPLVGIENLESTYLYTFAKTSLPEILRQNYGFLANSLGMSAIISVALSMAFMIFGIDENPQWRAILLVGLPVFFTLTVDYGRYLYFLFYFVVLGEQIAKGQLSDRIPVSRLADMLRDWGRGNGSPMVIKVSSARLLLPIIACMPIGFWVQRAGFPTPVRAFHELVRFVGLV